MLVVISPAKRLDLKPHPCVQQTRAAFAEDTRKLIQAARKLSASDLKKLMGISDALATLNVERFTSFQSDPAPDQTKASALMFDGDTYAGLEAQTLDEDAFRWAQSHLRILSGLYGLLRPLDAIQPYRLEMGSKLVTSRGKTLYDFWGDKLAKALNTDGESAQTDTLINCASNEYFGAVDRAALKLRVVTPVFMEVKDGSAKVISFYAKKARGAMARFMVQNRLNDVEALKDFTSGGYKYQPKLSEDEKLVFWRDHPA